MLLAAQGIRSDCKALPQAPQSHTMSRTSKGLSSALPGPASDPSRAGGPPRFRCCGVAGAVSASSPGAASADGFAFCDSATAAVLAGGCGGGGGGGGAGGSRSACRSIIGGDPSRWPRCSCGGDGCGASCSE